MDHNPSPLARVTGRYKRLDRWAQWATILALPLTALATLASLAALGGATSATGAASLSTPPAATSVPPPATSGQPSTVASQADTAAPGVVALKSHAPASFAGSCRAQAADMETAGLIAAIVCVPAGARGTYNENSTGATLGSWACYTDSLNRSVMMWTNTSLNILSMALSTTQTPQQLHDWFFGPGDPGPD